MFRLTSSCRLAWRDAAVLLRTRPARPASACRFCGRPRDGQEVAAEQQRRQQQEDEGGDLVYEGSLGRQLRAVKLFSLSTSALGLAAQALVYVMAAEMDKRPSWVLLVSGSIATVVLLSPLLVHLLAKRYVTHLYYDAASGTFTSFSLTFFNLRRVTRFKAEDVVVPTVRGPFTTYTVFRRPFFLDPLAFTDIAVFEHLVGYDKLDERLRGQLAEQGEQTANQTTGDVRPQRAQTEGAADEHPHQHLQHREQQRQQQHHEQRQRAEARER